MNKVTKYALAVLGFNLLLFLVMVGISIIIGQNLDAGLALVFFIPGLMLLLELAFGIGYLADGAKKDIGGGLVIGCGLTMLLALSGCALIANM